MIHNSNRNDKILFTDSLLHSASMIFTWGRTLVILGKACFNDVNMSGHAVNKSRNGSGGSIVTTLRDCGFSLWQHFKKPTHTTFSSHICWIKIISYNLSNIRDHSNFIKSNTCLFIRRCNILTTRDDSRVGWLLIAWSTERISSTGSWGWSTNSCKTSPRTLK